MSFFTYKAISKLGSIEETEVTFFVFFFYFNKHYKFSSLIFWFIFVCCRSQICPKPVFCKSVKFLF